MAEIAESRGAGLPKLNLELNGAQSNNPSLRAREGRRPRRVVRDRPRFFNQPAGMLKNLYAAVESVWEAYACPFRATCRTQDSRG